MKLYIYYFFNLHAERKKYIKTLKKNNNRYLSTNHNFISAFILTILFSSNLIETKSLNNKINLNVFNNDQMSKNITFPEILPKFSSMNFTDYNIFEHVMLNLKVNRIQAKEVHI